VDEDEARFGGVLGELRLKTDVKKPDAIEQLSSRWNGLAANGGKCVVAGGGVVCTRN
jgi:hypothetical protein